MPLVQVTPPPDLPRPPLWEALLFERPLPAVVALLLVAAIVAWTGLAGGRRRALLIALAMAALAPAWCALAVLVTTDREAVARRSRDLVRAVADVRVADVARILDQDATLAYFRAPAGLDRDGILREVERTLGGAYRVNEARVGRVQATLDGPDLARTQVKVTVVPEATAYPHLSYWRLDWRRGDDGVWRVFAIEPLAIAGVRAPGG
ncbi:MAG: hypothetical protein FJ255_01065 [Phycisphaerae bacterium]|nr:hypothetical protein [Phycisphaerae bacterium]